MTIETLKSFLLYSSIINIALMIFWLIMIVLLHDFVYKAHTKFFKLSVESFDTIHYCGMGLYKLGIFFFNVIPYVVLLIIG